MEIFFENNHNSYKLNNKRKLLNLANSLCINYDIISINIISNQEILEMNNKFLNHNYYTDILTFDLSDEMIKDAEIYISYEMALENSIIYKCTIEEEINRLIIHGFLHLAGYTDETEINRKNMKVKENYYLNKLFHVKTNEEKV
ncbi:MAG: rRNA maturation RNase YbeY [Bacteroidetes bacterium]|nr:rRNA maturation RNase YbeY [Bacteroidota bacterium]